MSEQIECVGGPFDGRLVHYTCCNRLMRSVPRASDTDYVNHIYHYDQSQSKYIYQGVEQ